jgi:molybdopterin molybdotransferase
MLTVDEALAEIAKAVSPLPAVRVSLLDALECVIAEPVVADIDSPPFDKSLMDGYAVIASDFAAGPRDLPVLEEITAGRIPTRPILPGTCSRIMTGAPLPAGADAVVLVEESTLLPASDPPAGLVRLAPQGLSPERNIVRRGAAFRRGDTVLDVGHAVRPQELGSLAELGAKTIAIRRRVVAHVLATGDELVDVGSIPGPGQIRNSNEVMLLGQLRRRNVDARGLGVARDSLDDLTAKVRQGLDGDLLLLSGGVSAGKLDLVPTVLSQLGVKQVFHKVRVKPGQPLWFGLYDPPERPPCFVFGLPGNPVSSMVCCELFVRGSLRRMNGCESVRPDVRKAVLEQAFTHKGERPTYHPAVISENDLQRRVRTVPWIGSSDLAATVSANGMAVFPAGERRFAAGEIVDVIAW